MKEASCLSFMMKDMGTPLTHMTRTLYTLIPIYLESFKAGILTLLVSQAKKHPNICKSMMIELDEYSLVLFNFYVVMQE